MRAWLVVAAFAAVASGCFHVTTAVVGEERWDLLGNDGKRWNAMVASQPLDASRCAYWRARNAEAHGSRSVEVLDAWQVGTIHASENLRAATAAAEREVCATGMRSTFHARAAEQSPR